MKKSTLLIIVALMIAITPSLIAQGAEKTTETVKFDTNIDCQNCVNTIMKNIPFEKGVKDVKCDLQTKIVTISYNSEKTKPELLKRALEKLGYSAKEIKPKS